MPNNRERKKRPPMTKKQTMIQLMFCLVIFIVFTIFPGKSGNKTKPTATPMASAQAVAEASGETPLTIDTINGLSAALPELQGEWKIYIQPENGGYVLLSPNVQEDAQNTEVKGYELGESVKARVSDKDTLSALLYKIPAGGAVTVANADGSEVDATSYASVADLAHKAGFKDVKLVEK